MSGDNTGGGDGVDGMLGRVLAGKYEIIALVGQGGFGAVYRAEQAPVGRIVAVKVIKANARDDDELRARFLREARSVARLKSPHIVTLFDYGDEPDGLLYMVFEFVEGTALDKTIEAKGTLDVQTALTLIIQILEALSEAHEYGIVHRDLKPANIIVSKGAWGVDVARVLDFGIAKVVGAGPDEEQTVETRQGLILGTPHYMAPEQAHAVEIDGRTDLYAIGILLFTMLKGHPPFLGQSAYSILEAHVTKPASEPLAELDAPEELKAVIARALEKHPDNRYQTAIEMAHALDAFVDAAKSQILPAPSLQPTESEVLPKPPMPLLPTLDGGPLSHTDPEVDDAPPTSKTRLVILAAVLIFGAAIAAYLGLKPDPPPPKADAAVRHIHKIHIGLAPDQGMVEDAAPAEVDAANGVMDAQVEKEDATRRPPIKRQCRQNSDCAGRLVCRSGKCVRPRPTRRQCKARQDCPKGQYCEAGKCKKLKVSEF